MFHGMDTKMSAYTDGRVLGCGNDIAETLNFAGIWIEETYLVLIRFETKISCCK